MFLVKITKFIFILVLLTILNSNISAQKTYSGDPVTKNGLVKALKMKQFKTSDMVSIINEQGCEFKLDKDTQEDLVKAGARPEVIEAVRRNYRGALKIKPTNSKTYEGLISQAINIYESESRANEAINILNEAMALEPNKYRAYQMMGYVLLYGKRKFKDAEDYMKKAIELGGSAVFRVSHGHDFSFLNSCSGSIYISQNNVRYEDDNNVHTFQVNKSDIIKIETIGAWGSIKNPKTWGDFTKLKKGLFKVLIQDKANVKDKDNYVFATDTGKGDEAKMIVKLIGKN